ncbi:unnamed protein product, partial [marine sediment metagenome]
DSGFQDGSFDVAQFFVIFNIARPKGASQDIFYVCDFNKKIRVMQNNQVSTILDTNYTPITIAVDSSNKRLFFTDSSDVQTIKQVNLSSLELSNIAGNEVASKIDGVGQNASFEQIYRMKLDSNEENLFVNDKRYIRRVHLESLQVSTIYSSDGIVDFALDTEWFYVLLNTGDVHRIDYSASTITTIAAGFSEPRNLHRTDTGLLVVGVHHVWSVNLASTCEAIDEDNNPFVCGDGFLFDDSKTDWLCT